MRLGTKKSRAPSGVDFIKIGVSISVNFWLDRKFLTAIIEKFDGGPVGVDAIASAIGEERGTVEDLIEPFLIQGGFLIRTPRGRMASGKTYEHFGIKPPKEIIQQEDLL